MAASQRPGFTGRSQTPPASKPLVRKIFFERLFLFLNLQTLVFVLAVLRMFSLISVIHGIYCCCQYLLQLWTTKF